ncbi:protein ETHYLENE-INSENSITIVE 2 isoform X1 [Canna indica]|uniref:Protein ETHYLENE-INSENSITIVE 2 isoform X1 n=1 Tax=Canna indica TaxID=4628 RepID=A0AAQ3KVK1_9LILI|nr:protein ETHYLENE-INSENSITIVE 2 isoform X1 [Canna indica]
MESMTSGGVVAHLFPALGPALVISMGYIDLGKWLAAVDGGARLGNDLVLLVLFFNLTAILCQYLATCVGIVTGKNLAEICRVEYSGTARIILGVQAEISIITSDLTMIVGFAHAVNLMFGVDLLACICLAVAGSVLFPLFIDLWNDRKAEVLYESISGFALLSYVLGVLISQPEIPLVNNVVFPKITGESAYSVMALLGANIMAHNFYIHSSIVQQQKTFLNVPVGALLHDHFFAILIIFTGISLVNYVLINSAAAVFGSTDIELNFHDVSLLMDQIFRIPIAPIAIFLVLLFSSQITVLAWNTHGPHIFQTSFGANISARAHVLLVKALSVIPALICAKCGGAEGMYQFLIFCQVIQAMLLPSSVIPLFRVASSRLIMGSFKMPWYLEIIALLAFLGMLASNVIFVIEMLFGDSNWINDLRGSISNGGIIIFAAILLATCASILFTLYLAVTPLKSASDIPETEIGTLDSQQDILQLSEGREDDIQDKITTSEDQLSMEDALHSTVHYNDRSFLESNLDQFDMAVDSDHDRHQTTDGSGASDTAIDSDHDCHQPIDGSSAPDNFIAPLFQTEEPKSINVVDLETMNETSTDMSTDPGILEGERHEFDPVQKDLTLEADISTDNEEILEPKEPIGERLLPVSETVPPVTEPLPPVSEPSQSSTSEDSGSSNIANAIASDGGAGSGSISKLSGLGRAARRQLAAILDEFWGHLFDFHGKPTQEYIGQKYDNLLGLDLKSDSSIKVDVGTESLTNFRIDADRGTIFPPNPMEYSSPKLNNLSNRDLSYGFQMGSSSRSRNMQLLNTALQSSSNSLHEPNERRYSSLYLPQYSDNHDYQPATVHGYQIASYLKGISAGRNPYSPNVSIESPRLSKTATKIPPGFEDSVPYSDRQNGLGSYATSSLQSPTASRVNRVQADGPYFDPSLLQTSENAGSSAYAKKYHSSPDISAIIAAARNSLLNESKLGGPVSSNTSLGRMIAKQQQYMNPISKTGASLVYDELYSPNLQRDVFASQSNPPILQRDVFASQSNPPTLQRDVFPPKSNLITDTKSLWSKQPFEQLFGVSTREQNIGMRMVTDKLGGASHEVFSHAESERKLLQSLRFCILKLMKLEGSDWLFRPNGGCDEELIYQVATSEKYPCKAGSYGMNQLNSGELCLSPDQKISSVQRNEETDTPSALALPNCGDGCIWRAPLVVSFGVWCVHRVLELSLVESRPELWGKYTYVLNRLQGILDLAFSKPRDPLRTCLCLEVPLEAVKVSDHLLLNQQSKPIKGSFTTASVILEVIKDVEISVSGRKGRTGTAAGDVAFPKGKENLASVLKRYKRRLSNKNTGTHEGSRKMHAASVS